jgi:hypothetical protein
MGDRLTVRPLPTQDNTNTKQAKTTHHAPNEILT